MATHGWAMDPVCREMRVKEVIQVLGKKEGDFIILLSIPHCYRYKMYNHCFLELSIYPKQKPLFSLHSYFSFLLLVVSGRSHSHPVSLDLLVLGISKLLSLSLSFISYFTFPPCCGMYKNFTPAHRQVIFYCMYALLWFVHSFAVELVWGQHFGCKE